MALNWSEGLNRLGNNLGQMAGYYAQRETQEWQERRDASQRAFQERILSIQQEFQSGEAAKQRDFTAGENQAGRDFTAGENALNREQQSSQFAQTMANERERLAIARAQLAASRDAAANQPRLGALQLAATQEGARYNSLIEGVNEEIAKLDENPLLSMNPERRAAAEAAIMERYNPRIEEQRRRMERTFNSYFEESGIEYRMGDPDPAAGEPPAQPEAAAPAASAPAQEPGARPVPFEDVGDAMAAIQQRNPAASVATVRRQLAAWGYDPSQIEAALQRGETPGYQRMGDAGMGMGAGIIGAMRDGSTPAY